MHNFVYLVERRSQEFSCEHNFGRGACSLPTRLGCASDWCHIFPANRDYHCRFLSMEGRKHAKRPSSRNSVAWKRVLPTAAAAEIGRKTHARVAMKGFPADAPVRQLFRAVEHRAESEMRPPLLCVIFVLVSVPVFQWFVSFTHNTSLPYRVRCKQYFLMIFRTVCCVSAI